jgi:diketogulonate reductase-like aldo/keto reductase
MKGNLDVFDFNISEEDVKAISALERGKTSVITSDKLL